jgi:uncharacterized LabA/DUF88 family protein
MRRRGVRGPTNEDRERTGSALLTVTVVLPGDDSRVVDDALPATRAKNPTNETAPREGAVGPGLLTLAGCRKSITPFGSARTLMKRVITYIDGMNLYHGLKDRHGRRHHWLDVERLSRSMLRSWQQLVGVNYFTARVRNQPASELRQETYLSALDACCGVLRVIEGRFQERVIQCRACGNIRTTYEEKETDVNIATTLVSDAVMDRFDTALIISADSDLAPAVVTARRLAPGKRFVVVFPPRRRSDVLRAICDGALVVGADKIRAAQLPDRIVLPSGVVLERPAYWR